MQDRYVQLQCHSCWQDGVGSVCFTPDSQTLITTGLRDGSLVCSRLRWAQGSKHIKRTNITIELWSIVIFSLFGNFKMPLKLDLKHFCFYNAFKFNRLKLSGAGKANAATQYGQSIADSFESVVSSENTVLTNMTDWDSQTQSFTRCTSFDTGEV